MSSLSRWQDGSDRAGTLPTWKFLLKKRIVVMISRKWRRICVGCLREVAEALVRKVDSQAKGEYREDEGGLAYD